MDYESGTGGRRLPDPDEAWRAANEYYGRWPSGRDDAFRRTRRTTTLAAAALIAAAATATGYFAHAVPQAATSNASGQNGPAQSGTTGSGGSAASSGTQRPSAHHAVATSGGSGVTVGSPGSTAAGTRGSWRDN
jgi:hypothetical protein